MNPAARWSCGRWLLGVLDVETQFPGDAFDGPRQPLADALRRLPAGGGDLGPPVAQGPLLGHLALLRRHPPAELLQQLLAGDVLAGRRPGPGHAGEVAAALGDAAHVAPPRLL